jgi:hypothetical protein
MVAHEARMSIAGGAPKATIATPQMAETTALNVDAPHREWKNLALKPIRR